MKEKMKKYEIFWVLLVPLTLLSLFKVSAYGIVYSRPYYWDNVRYIFRLLGSDASFMAVHFPSEFGDWLLGRMIAWIITFLIVVSILVLLAVNIVKIWKLLKREKMIDKKERGIE